MRSSALSKAGARLKAAAVAAAADATPIRPRRAPGSLGRQLQPVGAHRGARRAGQFRLRPGPAQSQSQRHGRHGAFQRRTSVVQHNIALQDQQCSSRRYSSRRKRRRRRCRHRRRQFPTSFPTGGAQPAERPGSRPIRQSQPAADGNRDTTSAKCSALANGRRSPPAPIRMPGTSTREAASSRRRSTDARLPGHDLRQRQQQYFQHPRPSRSRATRNRQMELNGAFFGRGSQPDYQFGSFNVHGPRYNGVGVFYGEKR